MSKKYRIRGSYYLGVKPGSIFVPEKERRVLVAIDSFKWYITALFFYRVYCIINSGSQQYNSIWIEKPQKRCCDFNHIIRVKDGI